MANLRTRRLLTNPTPPPSPIPTGKGSRSASNEPFARFLHDSLRVPGLALPPSYPVDPTHRTRPTPEVVDLRGGRGGCGDRIRDSGKKFGLVRISGHGISVDELKWLLIQGGEWDSEECSSDVLRRRNGNRKEEMLWVSSPTERTQSILNWADDPKYRVLSENMKNIGSKLEAIAEKVCQILLEDGRNQVNDEKIMFDGKESVTYLYRHNHQQSSMDQTQITLNNNENGTQLCLILHLFIEHCQIYVQSEADHLYFDAGPETLVVTIGKQLQEWSLQDDFKRVIGKMIFVPAGIYEAPDYSFSIKLNYFSSNSNKVLQRNIGK
ncbi:uncharacterized protein LOC133800709 isoform X2 [Humulus lupulus]|nr:uncharacterized protein LOC133800709 isoform X2 [Humulus lupulus]